MKVKMRVPAPRGSVYDKKAADSIPGKVVKVNLEAAPEHDTEGVVLEAKIAEGGKFIDLTVEVLNPPPVDLTDSASAKVKDFSFDPQE